MRSGYTEDCDGWELIRWRGAVASAMRGKQGQAFLREMLAAMDALEAKRLVGDSLQTETGEVCALGSLGRARGLDMSGIGPEDHESVARRFGIAHALACEVMYMNDEGGYDKSPEQRFARMRRWVEREIRDLHHHHQPVFATPISLDTARTEEG